ncbi:MAG: hypothetical protein JJV88_03655, partial [Sulfurovum sp.]|nr:hypothetical protein [Sulfurovaceae bacterium]
KKNRNSFFATQKAITAGVRSKELADEKAIQKAQERTEKELLNNKKIIESYKKNRNSFFATQ